MGLKPLLVFDYIFHLIAGLWRTGIRYITQALSYTLLCGEKFRFRVRLHGPGRISFHLKCLDIGVVKETSLPTHGFLHTGNKRMSQKCHKAVLQPDWWCSSWNTYSFSFQIVIKFLHVCLRVRMDIIAKTRVGEEQH